MKLMKIMLIIAGMAFLAGCDLTTEDELSGDIEDELQAQQESSGSTSSSPPSSSSSSSSSSGGAETFLWKPVSESNGNLVILFPTSLRGNIQAGQIQNAGGGVIENGSFAGDTHNGDRPHYRFSKPGSGYGGGIYAVAVKKDGTSQRWSIPDGGTRTEY